MSSLQKTRSGYRLQFRMDNKTKQLSLAGAKCRLAETTQRHVDELLASHRHGIRAQDSTLDWLKTISDELRGKLVNLGLIADMASNDRPMIKLFDEFVHSKRGHAQSTLTNYSQLSRKLLACFGYRPAVGMTRGDADDFRDFCLSSLKIGENTTRKRCSQASTFWKWMVRREVVPFNIFDDVPKAVGTAIARKQTIQAGVIREVLNQASSPEWRLLISLGRWGGLRIPSEAFALRWEDINFETGKIVVNSSKTAHQNKPQRTIPLFPELAEPLRESFECANVGEPFVIPRLRVKSGNVREPFRKMIKRAGFEPWPNLWNALRSTRETELAAVYPIHVVCEWMGNTIAVAARHYLKATSADFEKARAENAPKAIAANKPNRAQ